VNNSQEKSSEDLSRQRKESTKLKTRQLKVLGLKSRKKKSDKGRWPEPKGLTGHSSGQINALQKSKERREKDRKIILKK
jgi:hypothetical protein